MDSVIIWFRNDLRITDNPALSLAIESGLPIIPIFIWSPNESYHWSPGAASRWWLHHSLNCLDKSLRQLGTSLVIRKGQPRDVLFQLVDEAAVTAVFWNRRYEPDLIEQDAILKNDLVARGISVHSRNGSLLCEPWEVATGSGTPYRVFTPYWKSIRTREFRKLVPAPTYLRALPKPPESHSVEGLTLLPKLNWADEFSDYWQPGEAGAQQRLVEFLATAARDYNAGRNIPDIQGTSLLSPHLHFGEISPHQVWNRARAAEGVDKHAVPEPEAEAFLREIGWREFAYHLLFNFPATVTTPLFEKFSSFPWRNSPEDLAAWQRGLTGYPIVDAGMRQLWRTGWMHNRVRMIVGSFLVKHLLIPWQEGADWFWKTLMDADLANNTLGWQWIAGCGADAAPYFRVFNPILQGEKFDKDGGYVRKWVPELRRMPSGYIHHPWDASPDLLAEANVTLGKNYPFPIIEHKVGRERALEAYQRIR